MSDFSDFSDRDDPADRLVRAAIPGRSGFVARRPKVPVEDLWAPGRPWLEGSVILAAFAMLVPMCAAGSVFCALRAGAAGHPRSRLALAAAIWCAFLGVTVRLAAGIGLVP